MSCSLVCILVRDQQRQSTSVSMCYGRSVLCRKPRHVVISISCCLCPTWLNMVIEVAMFNNVLLLCTSAAVLFCLLHSGTPIYVCIKLATQVAHIFEFACKVEDDCTAHRPNMLLSASNTADTCRYCCMRAGHLTHAVHPWLMAREFGLLPLIHPFRRQQTHLLHVVKGRLSAHAAGRVQHL